MRNRMTRSLFQATLASILCVFFMAMPVRAVEFGSIFADNYEKLLEHFGAREYADVIRVFQEIERLWPNPLDRADSDNHAQYAQAMLDLDEGKYNAARQAFEALPADFRGDAAIQDPPPASGHMAHYVTGLLHEQDATNMRDGSPEKEEKLNEAIASYEAANGILNSAARLRRLRGRDPLPPGALSFVSGSATVDGIALEWADEDQRDGYIVRFAPVAVGAGSQTFEVATRSATLTGLIPQTSYAIEIRPNDDSADCLSVTVETKRAPQYESARFSLKKELNLLRYSAQLRGRSLVDIMNRNRAEQVERSDNRALVLVTEQFAQPPYGYLLHAVFENRHTVNVRIDRLLVLRVDDQCVSVERENMQVPVMSVATLLIPVDGLLAQVYDALGDWPVDAQGSIELYLDGMLVGYIPIAFARQ